MRHSAERLSALGLGLAAVAVGGILTFAAPASAAAESIDRVPPSVPTAFSGFAGYGAYFAWQESTDNATPVDKIEYVLEVDGVPTSDIVVGDHWMNEFDYPSCFVLLPSGTHTYAIRAVDEVGNTSAPSNSVTLTN